MSIKMNDDIIGEELVELCYKMASNGLSSGEVPVGCVFVYIDGTDSCGQVLASGHNRTNECLNGTRHAEMECMDVVVNRFGPNMSDLHKIMSKTTVLLTLEPCVMCGRALRHVRAKEVLFGATNDRFGGFESVYNVCTTELIDEPILNCYQVLDSNKCIEMLKMFYNQTNESAPKPHRKRLKTNQ